MGCSHAANIVEPSRAAQASKNKQQTTAATVATDVVRSATTTLTAKPEAKPVLLGQFCDTGSKLLDVQAGKEVESLGFVFTNVPIGSFARIQRCRDRCRSWVLGRQ